MRSVEPAASSLELFEGLPLVDVLSSINKLITLGQTLEEVKDWETELSKKESIGIYPKNQETSHLKKGKDADSPDNDDAWPTTSVNLFGPGSDFVVVICYHISFLQGSTLLKGLQAYIIWVQLLRDPKIKRVCWRPDPIQNQCNKRNSVCIWVLVLTLSKRVGGDKIRFEAAFEMYLKDWDVKPRFEEAKGEYEASLTSKEILEERRDQ
ncbi:uncharacterized protein EV154DRAFT_565510 [Mucor mucedo]|uniref:uncharacterized protein n=1 Tax=Mucor mucedo TaxID=29922 RepID=UPI00221E9811|nr:uncharacterized protein EV154DRAFT_565510 [Mucor mucedo]KAI7889264.1 hypothetical protein EV154DRAFT_565510 [Mucor mucedo]